MGTAESRLSVTVGKLSTSAQENSGGDEALDTERDNILGSTVENSFGCEDVRL